MKEKTPASEWIYFNGQRMPSTETTIAHTDRGFLLGDGAFETIRVIHSRPYLLPQHMKRLADTLSQLSIRVNIEAISSQCYDLIAQCNAQDAMLRITVSRGSGGEGYLPMPEPSPSIVITCRTLDVSALPAQAARVMVSDWRKIPPQCLPTEGKTLQGMNATLARMQAHDAGYDEALQLSIEGHIASVSSGNLFWREGNRIFTPSLRTGCLNGMMRQRIMTISSQVIEEIEAAMEALEKADAILYSNSRLLVRAVESVDKIGQYYAESTQWAKEWYDILKNDA
ncbi:MAG: aminotransferase class IV [Rickettsiales bacterium]|nr:aminotransferase class IV [Rickettsiales bacterium]